MGRVGLDLIMLHHDAQFGEIRGHLHREKPHQAGHQLHSSPVQAELLGENARQLPHVGEYKLAQ